MLFLLLLRDAPGAILILGLTLLVALYLTVIELRELQPHWKWWAWWLSLVFLIHFIGYLALQGLRCLGPTGETARGLRGRDRPLGRVVLLAAILVAALLVARSCGETAAELSTGRGGRDRDGTGRLRADRPSDPPHQAGLAVA